MTLHLFLFHQGKKITGKKIKLTLLPIFNPKSSCLLPFSISVDQGRSLFSQKCSPPQTLDSLIFLPRIFLPTAN